jgi:hypothetical protein
MLITTLQPIDLPRRLVAAAAAAALLGGAGVLAAGDGAGAPAGAGSAVRTDAPVLWPGPDPVHAKQLQRGGAPAQELPDPLHSKTLLR